MSTPSLPSLQATARRASRAAAQLEAGCASREGRTGPAQRSVQWAAWSWALASHVPPRCPTNTPALTPLHSRAAVLEQQIDAVVVAVLAGLPPAGRRGHRSSSGMSSSGMRCRPHPGQKQSHPAPPTHTMHTRAHMAVPPKASLALALAPASSSSFTVSRNPLTQASISAVRPSASGQGREHCHQLSAAGGPQPQGRRAPATRLHCRVDACYWEERTANAVLG